MFWFLGPRQIKQLPVNQAHIKTTTILVNIKLSADLRSVLKPSPMLWLRSGAAGPSSVQKRGYIIKVSPPSSSPLHWMPNKEAFGSEPGQMPNYSPAPLTQDRPPFTFSVHLGAEPPRWVQSWVHRAATCSERHSRKKKKKYNSFFSGHEVFSTKKY